MKKLLAHIIAGGQIVIPDGARAFELYAMSDGSLVVRITGSGELGPFEKPTITGLRRLLHWIDNTDPGRSADDL
jgi:hypothetical protein